MKLRSHLIALVITSLLPVILFAGVMVYIFYQQQRAVIDRGMVDTARALSLAVDRELAASIRALQALASSEYLTSEELDWFYHSASRTLKTIPGGESIALMSPSGAQILNLRVPFGLQLPHAAAPELIKIIIRTGKPAVSNLFHSPVAVHSVIVIGVPVTRQEETRYVLELSISPGFLATLLAQQKIPTQWTGTIVDGNKIIIARSRYPDKFIGQSVLPTFVKEAERSEEGLFRGNTRDGIPVYTAFHRSPLSGWTVALGAPVALVETPLRAALMKMVIGGLALLAGAVLFAAILGYRIARAVGQLAVGARAIGLGNIPSMDASGIVEIEQVRRELEIAAEQRQKMELGLRRNEANLIAAHRLARIGSWSRDLLTGVVTWSDEIFDIFGLKKQKTGLSYDSFLELIHPKDRASAQAIADEAFMGRRSFACEYRIIRPDGAVRVIHEKGSVVMGDDNVTPIRLFGTAQDVTERNQVEQGLRRSRRRLRALATYLQSVREQERTQMARELHDEVGQSLTAIKLAVEGTIRNGDEVSASLRPALEITNELMERVRDLSLELRPAMLDDLGLLPTLKWHIERYESMFKIKVDFQCSGLENRRFAPEVETAAYRIVQEALTNVARYAGVNKVDLNVQADENNLRITIEDRGTGYEFDSLEHEATGISGMRERAIALGGRLEIASQPGAGTSLKAELPVRGFIEGAPVKLEDLANGTEDL